jgi:predicted nucleotidyltransferase
VNIPRISKEALSPSGHRALEDFLRGLRRLYAGRLKQVILYGHKSRGDAGADLDVLVVIDNIPNRYDEISRLHEITAPITTEMNILVTALPVDAAEFENRRETAFFAQILRNGIRL